MSKESASPGNLSQTAIRGFAWMTVVVLCNKFIGLGGQWALGFLFTSADFGTVAMIAVGQLLVAGLRDVGLGQQLLQNRSRFDQVFRPFRSFAHTVNAVAMLALVGAGPVMAEISGDRRLLYIYVAMALQMPLSTNALAYKAKLDLELRFGEIARLESISVLLNWTTLVFSAYCGAGVYGYPISGIVSTLYLLYAYRRLAGPIPPGLAFDRNFFLEALKGGKWLILGAYASSLAIQGDYFVLGLMLSATQLGTYYFGFQLAASAIQLVAAGMQGILLPTLSAIQSDLGRLRAAFTKSTNLLSVVAGLVSFSAVYWVGFFIPLLWAGKWDAAVSITQAIMLTMPLRLLASSLASALLEARGRWRARTIVIALDGLLMMASAAGGAALSGIDGAAYAVALERGTVGTALYYLAGRELGWSFLKTTFLIHWSLSPYLFVSCIAWAAGFVRFGQAERFTYTAIACFMLLAVAYIGLAFLVNGVFRSLVLRLAASLGCGGDLTRTKLTVNE